MIFFATTVTGCGGDSSSPREKPGESPPPDGSDLLPKDEDEDSSEAEETDELGETEVPHDSTPTLEDPTIPKGFKNLAELNEIDPEKQSLMIFDGKKPVTGEACSIYMVAEAKDEAGNSRYFVRSTLRHGDDTHSYLILDLKDKYATKLEGIGSDSKGNEQDLVNFLLAKPGEIESTIRVNIKWWHINHTHIFSCEQLSIR